MSRGCTAPGRPLPDTQTPCGWGGPRSCSGRHANKRKLTESVAAPALAGTSRGPLATSRRSLPVADPATLPLLLQRWGSPLAAPAGRLGPRAGHDMWGGVQGSNGEAGVWGVWSLPAGSLGPMARECVRRLVGAARVRCRVALHVAAQLQVGGRCCPGSLCDAQNQEALCWASPKPQDSGPSHP